MKTSCRSLSAVCLVIATTVLLPISSFATAAPSITTQPQNQSGLAGSNAVFTIVASGQTPLSYEWSFNGTNLTNNAHISGAMSDTLIISNAIADDTGNYRVVVSNTHGSVISSNASLTVLIPATISGQPSSQSVLLTSDAAFTAAVAGTAPLVYQWYFNSVPLTDSGRVSGSATTNLNIANVQTNDTGSYQLVVTNSYGSATSEVATLTVFVPATVITSLSDQVTMVYSNVTLSVVANGTPPLTYHWSKDGTNLVNGGSITGANGANLTILNPQLADSGGYQVAVSNPWGTSTSTETLTVVPVLDWGNAAATPPASVTNVMAIASAGDVLAADFAVRADGTVIGWGSDFYGILDIPPNATNILSISAGTEQAIAVRADGTVVSWGYGGTNVPEAATNVVAAAVESYGNCLALRQDGTVVTWNGTSTPPADATNLIAIGAGFYSCLGVRQDGTIIGWGDNSSGEISPPPQATNIVAVSGGAFGAYTYSLALRTDGTVVGFGYAPGVPADATNLIAIAAGNSHWMGLHRDGTATSWGLDGPSPTNCIAIAACGDGYHDLALVQDPTVKLPPRFIQQPLGAVVQTNQTLILLSRAVGSLPLTFQWYFNGSPLTGATNNWLLLPAIQTGQGGAYRVVVTNSFGSTNSTTAVVWTPPAIFSQPSATVIFGSNVVFDLTSAGTGPMGYQWYFNGTPMTDGGQVAGSSSSNLTIADFQPANLGTYTVVLTNVAGSVTSAPATVTVLNPMITTQPENTFALGGSTATLSVTATGQPPLAYQWQFNGTNISGATNSSLILTNVVVSQSGLYSVVITNIYGSGVSSNAMLDIVPLTITAQPTNRITWLHGSAVLKVKVSGQGPFNFEWQCNGADVPGPYTNLLVLTNLQASQFGTYSVIVGNSYGAVTSSNADLLPSDVAVWGGNYGETNLTPGLTNIIAISGALAGASTMDCMALQSNGTVIIWPSSPAPSQLAGVTNLIAVACAFLNFDFGLRPDGTVIEWSTESTDGPFPIQGLTNIVEISAVDYANYLALTTNGTVLTPPGGLGSPQWATNVVAVAEGQQHSLILRADGTVAAWGNNSYGQTNVPPGLSNVVAIAAGAYHSLVLKGDGTVVAWGLNSYGETNVPTGLSNVVAIAAGGFHNLALKANGTVVAWGLNTYGQTNVPPGLTNVIAIAAGEYTSMALIGNGPPVTQALATSPNLGTNGFTLSLPTQSGRVYVLQYKNSLSDTNWVSFPLVPGNGSILLLTDPSAANSQRFYRVQRW